MRVAAGTIMSHKQGSDIGPNVGQFDCRLLYFKEVCQLCEITDSGGGGREMESVKIPPKSMILYLNLLFWQETSSLTWKVCLLSGTSSLTMKLDMMSSTPTTFCGEFKLSFYLDHFV